MALARATSVCALVYRWPSSAMNTMNSEYPDVTAMMTPSESPIIRSLRDRSGPDGGCNGPLDGATSQDAATHRSTAGMANAKCRVMLNAHSTAMTPDANAISTTPSADVRPSDITSPRNPIVEKMQNT